MLREDNGFTLMELLVVIAVIGVMAAIAVPEFGSYRARAFNSRAVSEGRNLLSDLELYYVDTEEYTVVPPGLVTASSGTIVGAVCGLNLIGDGNSDDEYSCDRYVNVFVCSEKGTKWFSYETITGKWDEFSFDEVGPCVDPLNLGGGDGDGDGGLA